jgi:hypothetical protein
MLMSENRSVSVAELHREMNALCGLVHFARERCYPDALTAHLEALLAASAAEAGRLSLREKAAA